MPTEVMEHKERGYSARNLVLIFLLCVAVCGVFFSAGFMVGRNERGSHSAPATEVVGSPSAIPPTVNPPPDGGQATPQDVLAGHASPSTVPDTEVIPAGGVATAPSGAKPALVLPPTAPGDVPAKPPSNPSAPAAGAVGDGITLQVAAVRNKQDAEHLVDILQEKGYTVFLLTPEFARAGDNLYRVLVGPFRARDDADKVRSKLTQEGFKPFVRH